MRLSALFLTVVMLLTSGCAMIGPDFVPPVAPVADSWMGSEEDPQLPAISEQHEEWWTVFDDPTLNGLVEEASRENLGLQAAGLRILEARAQLGIASGYLYPQQQNVDASVAAVGVSSNAANTAAGDLSYLDLATIPGFQADYRRFHGS